MDKLNATLIIVGLFLFSFGIVLTLRDAFDDFQTGPWGLVGGAAAGLGAVLIVYGRKV
jgi:hypothetical protein